MLISIVQIREKCKKNFAGRGLSGKTLALGDDINAGTKVSLIALVLIVARAPEQGGQRNAACQCGAGDGKGFFAFRQRDMAIGDAQQLSVGIDGYGGDVLEQTAKLPDAELLRQGRYLIPGVFLQVRNPQPFVAGSGVNEGVEDAGDGGLAVTDLPAGFCPCEASELEDFPAGFVEFDLGLNFFDFHGKQVL